MRVKHHTSADVMLVASPWSSWLGHCYLNFFQGVYIAFPSGFFNNPFGASFDLPMHSVKHQYKAKEGNQVTYSTK